MDDGFCVNSKQNDQRLATGNYYSIAGIFGEFSNTVIHHFVRYFPGYSWKLKQESLREESRRYEHIDRKEYALYAALSHLWAKQNFLDIPKWVYDVYYVSPEAYHIGSVCEIELPEEFEIRNVIADMREFINV